jgi:hypothetical protein
MTSLQELPLFNYATAPHNGTETSREAAEKILPKVNSMCRQVYDCIAAMPGGLTCEQVEQILGMKHQTASARIRDLASCQPPLIVAGMDENHKMIRRPTSSGSTARVYFRAEAA